MRWQLIAVWAAVTVVLMLMAISDFAFGQRDAKKLGICLALAVFWPIAALSSRGRELLFRTGKTL